MKLETLTFKNSIVRKLTVVKIQAMEQILELDYLIFDIFMGAKVRRWMGQGPWRRRALWCAEVP